MKNIICIALFIVIGAMNALGQKISGRVVDEAGDGISYVSIGIMGSTIGVVSDGRGYFVLALPDSLDAAEELSFSHISYVLRSIGISEIKNIISSGKKLEVVLTPKYYVIEEVVVFAGKMKESKFTRKGVRIPAAGASIGIGGEIGSVIDVAGEIVLSGIDFRILKNTHSKARVRINVYRIDSDSPELNGEDMEPDRDGDQIDPASLVDLVRKDMKKEKGEFNRIDSAILVNILHVPIYCDIPTSEESQEFSVSPNENLILPSGRYYISIEFVELEGEGKIYFPAFLHKSYIRENSMGAMQKLPVNIGLSVRGYKLSGK